MRTFSVVMLMACSMSIMLSGCFASRSNDISRLSVSSDSKLGLRGSSSMAVLHEVEQDAKPHIVRIETVEDLNVIYFVDEAHGWVASDRELYNTDDAGQHWTKVAINIPKGAAIKSVSFADQVHGWILLKSVPPTISNYRDYRFWLMRTDDRGQTWKLQYEESNTDVTMLAFADERNGWISGIKYKGVAPLRFEPLIIRTADGGSHWSDMSSQLKQSVGIQVDATGVPANDGVMRLLPEGRVGATVITSRNELVKTTDGGYHWSRMEVVPETSEHAGIRTFGKHANDKLWIAKATDGQEGARGLLEVQQADDSWSSYTLSGSYFADVVYLPASGDFLACGYRKLNAHGSIASTAKKEALLIRSSDGGKNWSVVYADPAIESVNAIFPLSSGSVWGVGTRGVIFRFALSNDLSLTGRN